MKPMRRLLLGAMLATALAGGARAAANWRTAVVETSDGRTVVGEMYLPGDRIFLTPAKGGKRYTVRLATVKKIETVIESESIEKKWLFKEDGRAEKVYTGETYPVRRFRTRVTFHDGETLSGHTMGKVLYVRSDGRTERFFLRAKMEGKVGETLEDLVYVKAVTIMDAKGGVLGTITGRVTVPAPERLLKVLAINRGEGFILEAALAGGGAFRVPHCTAGTYDLIAVTDRSIYVYFSREKDPGCARLGSKKLEEIRAWAAKIRDFFHVQDPLYGGGNAKRAFVLVRKERYGGTSQKGAELVRRYDVWIMHMPRKQWQITKRLYVNRELTADRDDPRERIVLSPPLGGHVVDAEHRKLDLKLKLGPTEKAPAPSGTAKED